MLKKIISGGQCGADIAAIDAAIECGIRYGGWLPKYRRTENGPLSGKYRYFKEMYVPGYPKRTEQNVIDSDGTVIFTYGKLSGGSALTRWYAIKHKKPWLHVDLNTSQNFTSLIWNWINHRQIQTLNVAGKTESKSPGIYNHVKKIISRISMRCLGIQDKKFNNSHE
jgi:hypothetical protein